MDLSPKQLRKHILTMAYKGNSGHIGCALSIVDILSETFQKMGPHDEFILSKGHGVMGLYAVYLELGKITQSQFDNYLQNGSDLHGLAEYKHCGVSGGSLGHGLPVAVGIALAKKIRKEPGMVYCLIGDGELQEGSCYEAIQFAKTHLENLTILVDENRLQAMGPCDDILAPVLSWLGAKWVIWKRTTKGHGVSFMENNNEWHYKRMTKEQYEQAMEEVENAV